MFEQYVETGCAGLCKHGESLCGDSFRAFEGGGKKVFVLSDGLGSGVKGNILSTLTATILGTMLSRGIPLGECIDTVAVTLPVCKVRKLAYATFSVLQLEQNLAHLVQYDNPRAIVLRDGKNFEYRDSVHFAGAKEIHESRFPLQSGDMVIMLSDGVTNAGIGKLAADGWERSDIIDLLERLDTRSMSAAHVAAHLASCCQNLSQDSLDDDTTIFAARLRERHVVNMLVGPPENREDDNRVLRLFLAKEGVRVVCGGTTAQAVSKFVQKPIRVIEDSGTEAIPAMGRIDGVDYVTEGVITLGRTMDLCAAFLDDPMLILDIHKQTDAASVLASLLIEKATDVNIYFGMASNTAHEGTSIDFDKKLSIVKALEGCLHKLAKNAKISFC